MYRKTFAEINLGAIRHNLEVLNQKFSNYNYHFAVVKADCYGHGLQAIQSMLDADCNYLAVATLEEALEVRQLYPKIPILCLGIIPYDGLEIAKSNNITITISNLDYIKNAPNLNGIKTHLKVNTGMNRLGFNDATELTQAYKSLDNVEGIYTHIYDAENHEHTEAQIQKFQELTSQIPLEKIPIVHIGASEATLSYQKPDFANGCRFGIVMYGFYAPEDYNLKSTFALKSEIIQINTLKPGESLGYGGTFIAEEETKIAVVPIGYADGIIRKNKGREVYINGKAYEIVGNICMDMLFVKVDNTAKIGDTVELLRDKKHIEVTAEYLDTIPYEVLCSVSKRVPRIYQ